MRLRVWIPTIALLGACKPPPANEPEPDHTAERAAVEPRASFELHGFDGRERSFDWSASSNMIVCRHYAEPERGDYLWIRLAETPEQDGDAGVRLDIDVCRFSAVAEPLASMPAGQHGSHCAAEPGFAIWWHERDDAFNTGPVADPERCRLRLDYDGATRLLRGAFECAPLRRVEDPGQTQSGRELSLAAGSFVCEVAATSPSP